MSTHVQQGESLSKLKKGYKPVLVKRGNISCEYGCIGNFRSEWDRQQHMIYAHEVDGEATTLRVINEAVRNIGRNTPLDSYSISAPPKKEPGDWTFVPRGSQSVRHSDNRSTKTSTSGWRTGISRVISFNKKSEHTTGRSVRSKTISNPIPHQSSLDAAERIGTDVAFVHRPRNPVDSMATSNSNAYSSGSSGIGRPGAVQDNPVALEAKDFDCSSDDDDRDSSPPSSPSPAPATPLDVHSSFTAEDFTKKLNNVHPNYHHHHHSPQTTSPNNARPPMPLLRSPASFSRPTPAAYPLLLRTNLDRQPSMTSIRSPVSLRSPTSVPTSPTTTTSKQPPTRPARPPVPTRNPARPLRASASSEDAHGRPTFTPGSNSVPLVRRSPSHGILRI